MLNSSNVIMRNPTEMMMDDIHNLDLDLEC